MQKVKIRLVHKNESRILSISCENLSEFMELLQKFLLENEKILDKVVISFK